MITKRQKSTITKFCVSPLILLGIFLTSCTSVQHSKLKELGLGVTAAKQQTEIAFSSLNKLTTEANINYAAKQPKLTEELFFEVFPSDAINKWKKAFSYIENYVGMMAYLTSPTLTEEYKSAMSKLGNQILEEKPGSFFGEIDHGKELATAFVKLSEILIRLKAEKDVYAVIAETDGTVHEIFTLMADAIGETNTDGIRGTVTSNWTKTISECKTNFMSETDPEKKRALVVKFVDSIRSRDAHDLTLASLRRSYIAIAEAHSSLLKHDDITFEMAISTIVDELKDARDILKNFK